MKVTSKTKDKAFKAFLWASALAIILLLLTVLTYVFVRGFGMMSPVFVAGWPEDNWEMGGVFPAIVGTLLLVAVALVFSVPIGVGSAIYLTEYAKKGRFTRTVSIAADSLNGVPSIVYGLFGMAIFLSYLKIGATLLTAGLTLGFMILPTVIRTSEVAIRSVSQRDKEGSYALGATKLQTVVGVILPSSIPGIVTGIILGLGRAAGETAPIVFLVTLTPLIPSTPLEPVNALTYVIYVLTSEATKHRIEVAFGISLILIALILVLNYAARMINSYLSRNIRR
ncbi:MAG: phosphate ABC transporter permease PstA [Candidatus Altiarchaeota archaeon]|nr:phosphate ABC transporter permease PstA [Candidatus Altiarchaeota archaeon]